MKHWKCITCKEITKESQEFSQLLHKFTRRVLLLCSLHPTKKNFQLIKRSKKIRLWIFLIYPQKTRNKRENPFKSTSGNKFWNQTFFLSSFPFPPFPTTQWKSHFTLLDHVWMEGTKSFLNFSHKKVFFVLLHEGQA